MRRILSCQFNIDTACVDVEYEDGFVLSIYTPTVEDAVAHTMQQRSELDWLIYNDPLAYVGLVMSGKSEEYLKKIQHIIIKEPLNNKPCILVKHAIQAFFRIQGVSLLKYVFSLVGCFLFCKRADFP